VAAILATIPEVDLDALAAALAKLLISAARHQGPPRRTLSLDAPHSIFHRLNDARACRASHDEARATS
jgi:hypothetical protein